MLLVCALLTYAPLMMAAETDVATGVVAETMQSGGYVYIRLEDGVWIAANTFAVSEGDKIQYSGAMEMQGFHSKSLDRSFESILFVAKASLVGGSAEVSTVKPMPDHGSMKMAFEKPALAMAPVAGEIKPLADGKTVAMVFSEAENLDDKTISLNARVIKINKSIMGRNWITLQDGTGTEPDNKLLATSQEEVEPGDLVLVKGTVKTDIDLGYGYKYKVLLEESTFSPGEE